ALAVSDGDAVAGIVVAVSEVAADTGDAGHAAVVVVGVGGGVALKPMPKAARTSRCGRRCCTRPLITIKL
ncbi:MAG: hypothetical protein WBQ94_04925, partial [Terracidiphilus sp.]